MSELKEFLKQQQNVEQVNRLGYNFIYNGVHCYGQIVITPNTDDLTIKPMNIKDDIGNGAGQPVRMSFKKGFWENISERSNASEAIMDFLKGKTVQECLDTLDAVKRKILGSAVW
jgi:hypothetical protein